MCLQCVTDSQQYAACLMPFGSLSECVMLPKMLFAIKLWWCYNSWEGFTSFSQVGAWN